MCMCMRMDMDIGMRICRMCLSRSQSHSRRELRRHSLNIIRNAVEETRGVSL